jgi:hypothetical protein
MRLVYTVSPQLSEDTAQQVTTFGPLSDEAGVIVDAYQNENSGRIAIKAGTAQFLSMGTLGYCLGFYLRLDADCQISINGSTPMQLMRASQKLGTKARMFFEGLVTSVQITAPSDTAARGLFVVWGDPVAGDTRFVNLPLVIGAVVDGVPILAEVISGTGAPTDTEGGDGQSYIDVATLTIYGPKADGVWPTPGRSIAAPTQEAQQFFEGEGPPDLTQHPTANSGDLYIDVVSGVLYTLEP